MSRYIHDKTTHELIPVSGFGSRVATSVNGNTLKVHGGLLDIEGYNYGEGDITTAVQMIAPIESTLIASKAYAVGDQFVYGGLLYKATAAISSGAAIVIGTNCQVSPSVTEQIKDFQIDNGVTSNPTSVAANATAYWDVTFSKPFSATPSVCVSVVTGSPLLRNASIYGVSTTGFTVYFTNNTSAVNPETMQIHWIAVAS